MTVRELLTIIERAGSSLSAHMMIDYSLLYLQFNRVLPQQLLILLDTEEFVSEVEKGLLYIKTIELCDICIETGLNLGMKKVLCLLAFIFTTLFSLCMCMYIVLK